MSEEIKFVPVSDPDAYMDVVMLAMERLHFPYRIVERVLGKPYMGSRENAHVHWVVRAEGMGVGLLSVFDFSGRKARDVSNFNCWTNDTALYWAVRRACAAEGRKER